jgi:DNA-binding beta-propeller fold protein YncE
MKRLSGAIVALRGRRLVVALAAPGCVAACLVLAGTAAAPASVSPRAAQVARFDGAGHAVLARPGNVARAGPGALGGSVVLGGSPGAPAANPKTDTLYVPVQCATSFCASGSPGHVVDVINTATCNVKVRSQCRVVATAGVGSGPLAAAVDERTDTVYVMNGNDDTVSVLDGARCNARVTRGCGRPVATIKVGTFPVAAALSRRTRTLYVANGGGSISVINAAVCNARTTLGCGRPARTVTDKAGPAWIDVDVATGTVYVANAGASGNGDTVSVINGAACNGHTGRGCGRIAATVRVGGGAFAVAVDQASNTIYVPSNNDGTVSVINGAACNARVTSGCRRTPPTVTTGANPQFVVVGHRVHTAFTINHFDDTLSAINTRTCQGSVTSGCRERPPNQQATPDHGPGFNSFPTFFTLVPGTGSAYVVNVGGRNILSVTSTSRCNATDTTGCADHPATVTVGRFPSTPVLNTATQTMYVPFGSMANRVAVVNTATCNATDTTGCG